MLYYVYTGISRTGEILRKYLAESPANCSIGAGFTTFDVDISNKKSITPVDSEIYTMAVEGPNDLRQEHPHPHDAILDPDGRFVLVPDLGTDLIQRYLVTNDGRRGLVRLAPIVVPAGSGPRHGVFVKTADAPTYFYLLSEMGNSITGYLVSYPGYSSIELTQVYYTTIHETGGWMPNGKDVLGGEIGLSVSLNLSEQVPMRVLTPWFWSSSPTETSS